MAAKRSDSTECHLNSILARYLTEAESGNPPDRQQIVDAHPEFADQLRQFFDTHDSMQRMVAKVDESLAAERPIEPDSESPTLNSIVLNAVDSTNLNQ